MSIAQENRHIVQDNRGVSWIEGTNLKVIELVREHLGYGWSADELQEQHPYLTLGQIHATLGFFYDHQSEFEAQLRGEDEDLNRLRERTREFSLQRRLRALARKP